MGVKGHQAFWDNRLMLARGMNANLSGLSSDCASNLTRVRYGQNCIGSDTFKLTFNETSQDVYVRRNRNFDQFVQPGYTGSPTGINDDSTTDAWANLDVTAQLLNANYTSLINASYQFLDTETDPSRVFIYGGDPTIDLAYKAATIVSPTVEPFLLGASFEPYRAPRFVVGKMPETWGGDPKYYIAVIWQAPCLKEDEKISSGPVINWISYDSRKVTLFFGIKFLDAQPDLTASGSLWPLTIDSFLTTLPNGAEDEDAPEIPWWWTPTAIYNLHVGIGSGTYTLTVNSIAPPAAAFGETGSPAAMGTTSAIAYNASASDIQSAVEAIACSSSLGSINFFDGHISVSGTYPDFQIIFSPSIYQPTTQAFSITTTTTGLTIGGASTTGMFRPGAPNTEFGPVVPVACSDAPQSIGDLSTLYGTGSDSSAWPLAAPPFYKFDGMTTYGGTATLYKFAAFTNGINSSVTIQPVDRPCRPACGDYCTIFQPNPNTGSGLGAKITIDSHDFQYSTLDGGGGNLSFAWGLNGASERLFGSNGEADHNLYSSYPASNFRAPIDPFTAAAGTDEFGAHCNIRSTLYASLYWSISFDKVCDGTCQWEFTIFKQNDSGAGYWIFSASAATFPQCPPLNFNTNYTLCETGTLWGTKPDDPVISIGAPDPIPCPSTCDRCGNYAMNIFYRAHGGRGSPITLNFTKSGCTWTASPAAFTTLDGSSITLTATITKAIISPYTNCRFFLGFTDGTCTWVYSQPIPYDVILNDVCPAVSSSDGGAWIYEAAMSTLGGSGGCPPPILGYLTAVAPPPTPCTDCATCESSVPFSWDFTIVAGGDTIQFTGSGTLSKDGSCNYSGDGRGSENIIAGPDAGESTESDASISISCVDGVLQGTLISDSGDFSEVTFSGDGPCAENMGTVSVVGADGSVTTG